MGFKGDKEMKESTLNLIYEETIGKEFKERRKQISNCESLK